jgi:hypothetical protein
VLGVRRMAASPLGRMIVFSKVVDRENIQFASLSCSKSDITSNYAFFLY